MAVRPGGYERAVRKESARNDFHLDLGINQRLLELRQFCGVVDVRPVELQPCVLGALPPKNVVGLRNASHRNVFSIRVRIVRMKLLACNHHKGEVINFHQMVFGNA